MKNVHKVRDYSNVFFTADTHFGHDNIIKYCNRPFADGEVMDRELIRAWNEVVPPDGVVYHLGDFAYRNAVDLKEYREQLNGYIHLILGNHDKEIRNKAENRAVFESVSDMLVVNVRDPEVDGKETCLVLGHYPYLSWFKAYFGSWNLFGHVHGTLQGKHSPNQLDVGVDVHNYAPISYNDVKTIITQQNMSK